MPDQANRKQAIWSDGRDWQAADATVREAIDASPHRDEFMAVLATFTAKANRHETVSVRWWSAPRVYVGVDDARHEYPFNGRALVSFDLTNGKWASHDSEHRYVFARRGWTTFIGCLIGYSPPVYGERSGREADAAMSAPAGTTPITVTGRAQPFSGFRRHWLSNGWFIDGATRRSAYLGDHKYTLYEPGGHPSGCAGLRGSAPTLNLALAIANGQQPCGRASFGCRKLAIGYRPVMVHGREARVYYCEDHAPAPEAPAVPAGRTRHNLPGFARAIAPLPKPRAIEAGTR
jgi:hypothetical protein